MADMEDDEKFLYGGGDSQDKEASSESKTEGTSKIDETVAENGQIKDEDDSKEAGELSNEDDEEDDDDDDDDDDDVQVTIGEISTSAAPYGAPYAPPVNWNFKGGASKDKGMKDNKHLDVDAVGTVNGVSVHEFDLDSVDDKPWRKPGADITDYFNYGFTEDTWKQYCEKQRRMRMELQMPKKIFVHQPSSVEAGMMPDGRPRKAGPPPERKMEGSIDVIGGEGSRVESRRRREDDVMMGPMMGEGMNPDVGPRGPGMMNKRHFQPGPPGGPHGMPPGPGAPPFLPPHSDPGMGPPNSGPPHGVPMHGHGPPGGPMPPGMPPPFRPMGGADRPHHPDGAPPGMPPPGMPPMGPGMGGPPHGFPPDMGMPPEGMPPQFDPGFPRPGPMGMRGRGRGGRGHMPGPPGMPGMPPPGEFPQGIDERGPRPFEEGAPFFPGDPNQPFHPMMGPPPGMPWEPGMGRGFPPGFREAFPPGLVRPGSESPGDDDSEYGSSDEDRKREREPHRRRERTDRDRTREHRDRNRDRSPRRERDRDRERRDRDRRHRGDREKGGDRERREDRSSRKDRDRTKEQREKKRHSKTATSDASAGHEEGELVSTKKKSRRTREPKEPKTENTEPREEGQRTPTP